MKQWFNEIRFDLRRWNPADSLDTYKESDVFEPNTLAVILREFPDLVIEPWDAVRVVDQLTDLLMNSAANDAVIVWEKFAAAQARGKNRIKNQLAAGKLPLFQRLVFEAEKALGINAPNAAITEHLRLRGQAGLRASNVARARKALRDKGL